ncbi:MAG: type II secretion system GspH family protein [Puniceicoccales bacterium]|jgi:type II secretory pathway pseudopilin PulG|nr:type II secretion system GspH family protein [Puniceicoccales bacterium]
MTLIEMLTVVSILLILLSIVAPAVNSARISALQKQGSMQFQRFIHALRDYYSEYQSYPPFMELSEDIGAVFELGSRVNSQNFIRALSGKEPNGSALTAEHLRLNPKRIVFLEISPDDLLKTSTGDREEDRIADIFNNEKIFILLENPSDDDRRIPQILFPEAIKAFVPEAGLLSDIAIWSIHSDPRKNVRSWK